jgi:hypothetical protein
MSWTTLCSASGPRKIVRPTNNLRTNVELPYVRFSSGARASRSAEDLRLNRPTGPVLVPGLSVASQPFNRFGPSRLYSRNRLRGRAADANGLKWLARLPTNEPT